MKKYSYKYIILGILLFSGCTKVLDKDDLSSITEDQVLSDPSLIRAALNNLYTDIPHWTPNVAKLSDESYGRDAAIIGTLTADNSGNDTWYWPYTQIRKCNEFIDQIPEMTNIDAATLAVYEGEARFLRAFQYFELVRRYGGVPLITHPQTLEEDYMTPRTATSACIEFIVNELDAAADVLPSTRTGSALGRVTKGAALGIKGRVLLYYASPQFNPTNIQQRWTDAFNANNEALQELDANGYGLYASYENLFLDEMNEEIIFAIRFANPGRTTTIEAQIRPISVSINATGGNHPTQELVDAYPMADGTDPDLTVPKEQQWTGRDPRFAATIVVNGDQYFGRTQYTYIGSGVDAYAATTGSITGYYSKKFVDQSLTAAEAYASGRDFVNLRYAEVLLNYAEAANELGQTATAYEAIGQIRDRAGIPAGAGTYGLPTGLGIADMRMRILRERQVEFAFEQKRFWDIRRMRLGESILNGSHRTAYFARTTSQNPLTFAYESFNLDVAGPLVWTENLYFFPIQTAQLITNPNLQQTVGWPNGTFDPLN